MHTILFAEYAATRSTSNLDEPPPYHAYISECAPDGFISDQATLHDHTPAFPPPDYTSVISTNPSVPVPPTANI